MGKIEISESTNFKMLEAVYESDSYELSIDNVCLMLKCFCNCSHLDTKELKSKLFTFIFSDKESFLAQYVKAKLKPFLDVFLDQCNECTDDEDIAVEVLNFLIDISQAKRYLDVLKIKILHAEKLKPSVIEYAIEKRKDCIFH